MHLIDGAGNVNNSFVSEDSATGRPPTEITADIMNALQYELANFILSVGVSLKKDVNTQLRDALTATFSKRADTIHFVREIFKIVADQAELGEVNTVGLQAGSEILVTHYYGLTQSAMCTWAGGTWIATPTPLNLFDLYGTTSDNHGYYWFANTWNLYDIQTIMPEEATEETHGIIRLATWAEVLAGSLSALAVRPQHMIDYLDDAFIGSIQDFSGTTPSPVWVPANGQLITRASRPRLWQFAQGGTNLVAASSWASNTGKFSSGDGVTTFRVPDLRGEFRRGWDNGRGLDTGRALGSQQGDAIRNIVGTMTGTSVSGIGTAGSGAFSADSKATLWRGPYQDSGQCVTVMSFDVSRVVPTASENRVRNISVPVYIYAGAPVS